jgi:hypothetical protein
MQACINPACGSEKANTDSTSSRATQQKACLPAPHMQASTCRQQQHDTQDTNHTRQHSTHHTKQQDYAHLAVHTGRHKHKKDANSGQLYAERQHTWLCRKMG